uniref:Uncharacterized protein n=1 Tax=Anguilla anguilla TaxID=7936 RepID=A0A0E9U193_ANGAN
MGKNALRILLLFLFIFVVCLKQHWQQCVFIDYFVIKN